MAKSPASSDDPNGKKPKVKKPAVQKSSAQRASKKAANSSQFAEVFARLKAILQPYAADMVVVKDDATWYYLDTRYKGKNRKPIMFAATRLGKAYVSYYLMTIYCNPQWIANMTPELRKRMQGKACFNFTEVNETLFQELVLLTRAGSEWFNQGGLETLIGTCS